MALAPISLAAAAKPGGGGLGKARRMSDVLHSAKGSSSSNKDNIENSNSPSRKRRTKSMGGVEMLKGGMEVLELSPRKKARRSLVPGRSILKPVPVSNSTIHTESQHTGTYTFTISQDENNTASSYNANITDNFTALLPLGDNDDSPESSQEATSNQQHTLNMSRRLSRRVSFAPTAQMREFEKDQDEESAATSPVVHTTTPLIPLLVPEQAQHDPANASTTSPAKSRRRSSTRGNGHRRRSSIANTQTMVDSLSESSGSRSPEDEHPSYIQAQPAPSQFADASDMSMNVSMDLVDNDTTTAFKSHFIFPRTSIGHAQQDLDNEADVTNLQDTTFGDDGESMVMAEDITSAFAASTHLFGPARRRSLSASPKKSQPASPGRHLSNSTNRDFQVPLGVEGITEDDIERINLDKARRGSKVFFSNTQGSTTPSGPSPSKAISSLFSQHHTPASSTSLYPSLETLVQDIPVPVPERDTMGATALAFLDADEDDEPPTDVDELERSLVAKLSPTKSPTRAPAKTLQIPEISEPASNPEAGVVSQVRFTETEEEAEIELVQEEEDYQPLEQPLFVPRNSRLSIVPENRTAEEEAEEDEEDDRTQDMDETAAFGKILGASTGPNGGVERRLSVMHPSMSASASPAALFSSTSITSITNNTTNIFLSPGKVPRPSSPVKSSLVRRQSLGSANASASPFKSPSRGAALFRSVPASLAAMPSPRRVNVVSPFRPSSANLPRVIVPALTPSKRLSVVVKSPRLQVHEPQEQTPPAAPVSEPLFSESALPSAPLEEEQEGEKLSLDNFLELIDIQFIDSLLLSASQSANPTKRRKSVDNASSASSKTLSEIRLADQIITSGSVIPSMDMVKMMVKELRNSLTEDNEVIEEIESTINDTDDNPMVFEDYLRASDEDRALMEAQFRLTKTYYRLETKNEWYDYKYGVLEKLVELLDAHKTGLEQDKKIINETRQNVEATLPELRRRAEEVRLELEKEKKKQAELETEDREYLEELRGAIAEQNTQLEDFKRENAEAESNLSRLVSKTEEFESSISDFKSSIQQSQKICDQVKYYTKTEEWKLQDELNLIEYLHSWRLVQFDSERVELCHKDEISITVLLRPGGLVEDFELILLESQRADDVSDDVRRILTGFLFDRLNAQVANDVGLHARDLLRRVSTLWTSARRIRQEVLLVSHRYPMTVNVFTKKSRSGLFLRANARIFVKKIKSEFNVTFELTGEELSHVSGSQGLLENVVEHVGCSVDVKYGRVDQIELAYVVRERVSHGGTRALLEACQEAEAKYA